jgi:hypothetical protein
LWVEGSKAFFFVKKNQKTFLNQGKVAWLGRRIVVLTIVG